MSHSPRIRRAFMERLETKTYHYLRKKGVFADWRFGDLYFLVKGIIEEKKDDINRYLDTHIITLDKADEAAEKIIEEIIEPEIRKTRI